VTFQTIMTPPKVRRGLLLGASGLTLAIALGVADQAAAINECGAAAGAPPSVTCKASGNPYPGGITYDVTDLTIVVKRGVMVNTTTAAGEIGGIVSGGKIGELGGTGDLTVIVNSGVTITTDETEAPGVVVNTGTGTATINSKANVTASGGFFGVGLWAQSEADDVSITAAGTITTSGARGFGINAVTFGNDIMGKVTSSATINTSGDYGFGIVGDTGAGKNADVTISSSGKITTSGYKSGGLYSYTHGIDSDVQIVNNGTIVTTGQGAQGVRAITNGDDSVITVVSMGKITTSGGGADGIYASARYATSDITIVSTGKITTSGEAAEGIDVFTTGTDNDVMIVSTGPIVTGGKLSDGIWVETIGNSDSVSIVSTGAITTAGDYAYGIGANTVLGASPVSITSTGAVTTSGKLSHGLYVRSAFSDLTVISTGKISTKGEEADGISTHIGTGNIAITSTAPIVTTGVDADGISADSFDGAIKIGSSGTIKTSGAGSEGIWALANDGAITISAAGAITTIAAATDAVHADAVGAITVDVKNASAGGLDSDGIDVVNAGAGKISVGVTGAVTGGGGLGIGVKVKAVDGASITVGTGASTGALSDYAFDEGGEDLLVTNKGTITGFFNIDGGNDNVTNSSSGVWEFRHFADNTGDGVPETESVAFAHFGPGTDIFNNSGTVRLSDVIGATTVNAIGQIKDPFGTDGDVTLAGVEHGQMVGLEQFVNAGTITMLDGTVGDALAMTDQPVAGVGGGGVFTSNGGALKLDVVLDDGSSGATDMLFLDIATTGKGGATRVFVANAGGTGALTTGDGIQIINVDVASSSDAFTLGAPVVAGAFQYELEFQNLSLTDQNWYLRSTPFAAAAAYPAISSSALTTWRADLSAFEDRLSDLRLNMTAPAVTMPVMVAGIADGGSMTLDPARFTGGWFNMTDSDDSVSQSGIAGFSQETSRAEMGFDFALDNVSGRDDWLVIGAFGGQGWSQADFSDADSSADFDIAAMGVYASYFQGPYHLDALVKFDWLDGEYSSDAVSGGGDLQLPVFGVSLNTGYQFDLTKSAGGGLSLQPIAALDYAHVGGDTFRDDSGATIELMEMDSLRGRLGARLVQQLLPAEDGTGPVGNFYLSAGIAQEFLGESEARVTGVTLTQELPETTFELGAGFDLALPAEGVSFTFDTSADFSEGEDNYDATGGVKFTW
jgi:autotransporter family porin